MTVEQRAPRLSIPTDWDVNFIGNKKIIIEVYCIDPLRSQDLSVIGSSIILSIYRV